MVVLDTQRPEITGEAVSLPALWPPNHAMRDVWVNYTHSDNCAVTSSLTVTSNEPENSFGDGDLSPDFEIVDEHHVRLRAERAGTGNGRTYTITIQATDSSGNATTTTIPVDVAHNITAPKSGAAFRIGTPVSFTGRFCDVPGSRHTAQWFFDALSAPGTVTEPTATKWGSVRGSYTFGAAGVYGVQLRVTDANGASDVADNIGELESIVVIYDPAGGYVAGGGAIAVPRGAFPANPELTGNAEFGFVSKYFKSATNPKGETTFGLKAGNFQFNALNFEYLAIAGAKAQFKGSGKVNDEGGHSFILTVIDGQQSNGGGIDKLRLKIWNKSSGQLIFDNQLGAADNTDPTTPVSAGSSIVIQNK